VPGRAAARRLARESKTVRIMIGMYCRDRHGRPPKEPCAECAARWEYAQRRVDRCPLRADKPTCAKCPVHCYKPDMRERIRAVMRYAGPRMLRRHPYLAIMHLIDGRRAVATSK